jgi:hypothetical protein
MRKTLLLVGGAVVFAALALAGTAAAAPRHRYAVNYVETFNTAHPNTPTGVFLKSEWLGDRPGEKPTRSPTTSSGLTPARGLTSRFPRCVTRLTSSCT